MPVLDTGATAWMLVSTVLVLLMTPALSFFYGGMARTRGVLNMIMMSFGALGVVGIVYVLWGWSMSYGPSLGGIVGNPLTHLGLRDVILGADGEYALDAQGVPVVVGVVFQLTFAVIATALVSGAVADRVRFSTWLVFAGAWATVVFFPLAHMVWGGGLLSGAPTGIAAALFGVTDGAASVAPVDFAGGTVVHIAAGVAGLVLAIVTGSRRAFGREPMRPHNLPMVMLGAALLWIGWAGFNGGSAFTADGLAGLAWLNSIVCACAAMLAWLGVERVRDGHPTSLGAASGVVAGLVAITPAAGALTPMTSIVMGVVAGVCCAMSVDLKYRVGLDDSMDVVGVHLVGGLVGTVLIGILATEGGLISGDARLLVVQVVIALAAVVVSGLGTLVVALVLRATMGWRIDPADELAGIDLAEHAESAYSTVENGRIQRKVQA